MTQPRATAKTNDDPGSLEQPQLEHRSGWRRLLPRIRRRRDLEPRQSRLLGVLGTANLIDNYDVAILGLALPQIQAGLMIAEDQLGGVSAVIRLGVIPAVILAALADGFGRRLLLLVTILGFTALTAVTSLAQTTEQFVLAQFFARVFIAAESILAVVVIAEEFGARTRGWGIGVLGAMGALGHGVAALVFAAVNVLPFGWRAMYLLGIAPLLMLAWFRRSLKETERFEAQRRSRGVRRQTLGDLLRPFRHLVTMYPGRMLAMCGALMPVAFVFESSGFFASKVLQSKHGYGPGDVTLLYLTAGIAAPIGNILAGSLGDRFGRKWVMIAGIIANAAAVAAFYNGEGWVVPFAWSCSIFTLTLVLVLFAALGAELFPTSYRSTASGVRAVVSTLSAAFGLWIEGLLYNLYGSHGAAITAMLVVTPIAPIVAALFLPETASRELEEISPERQGA